MTCVVGLEIVFLQILAAVVPYGYSNISYDAHLLNELLETDVP